MHTARKPTVDINHTTRDHPPVLYPVERVPGNRTFARASVAAENEPPVPLVFEELVDQTGLQGASPNETRHEGGPIPQMPREAGVERRLAPIKPAENLILVPRTTHDLEELGLLRPVVNFNCHSSSVKTFLYNRPLLPQIRVKH